MKTTVDFDYNLVTHFLWEEEKMHYGNQQLPVGVGLAPTINSSLAPRD